MGNLSNAMGTLVEQIRSSTLARHSEVGSIRDRTEALLERYQSERRKLAENVAGELSAAMRRVKGSVRTLRSELKLLRDEFGKATEQRRVAISEICSAVQGGLERNRIQRQENAEAFLKKTRQTAKARQKNLGDLKSAVRALRTDFRRVLTTIASDVAEAGRLWSGVREKKPVPRRAAVKVKAKPTRKVEEEEKLAGLPSAARRILRVIERYTDGVRLVDIGNQLGVDWRVLIGPIRVLMDQGKVEKVENLYYPVQE